MAFYIFHPCYFSISVKEACATTCNKHKKDIKFISDSPSKGIMAVSILLGDISVVIQVGSSEELRCRFGIGRVAAFSV